MHTSFVWCVCARGGLSRGQIQGIFEGGSERNTAMAVWDGRREDSGGRGEGIVQEPRLETMEETGPAICGCSPNMGHQAYSPLKLQQTTNIFPPPHPMRLHTIQM